MQKCINYAGLIYIPPFKGNQDENPDDIKINLIFIVINNIQSNSEVESPWKSCVYDIL